MQGEEKAAGSSCLQSSHIRTSATVSLLGAFCRFLHRLPSPGFPWCIPVAGHLLGHPFCSLDGIYAC